VRFYIMLQIQEINIKNGHKINHKKMTNKSTRVFKIIRMSNSIVIWTRFHRNSFLFFYKMRMEWAFSVNLYFYRRLHH
jgi:hypothetical protein